MNTYLLFMIVGDCEQIVPIGKIDADSAKFALRLGLEHNTHLKVEMCYHKTIDDLIEEGSHTGGEGSTIFGKLPFMYDSWIVIREDVERAVVAFEEMALFAAMLQSVAKG